MADFTTSGGTGTLTGTNSADIMSILDGSQTVNSGNGADIVIDFSDDNNSVNAGAGNDLVKSYVTQNLLANNTYNGSGGDDTLMFMVTQDQYNAMMGTTILQDFGKSASFDFSKYDAALGFHLDVHAVNFEHLVLNQIAEGAVDNSKSIDEDHVLNITKADLLANVVDDQYKENIVLVPMQEFYTTLGAHVIVNADGSIVYDPTVSSVLQSMNNNDSMTDSFIYQLEVRDPDNPNILISTTTATMNITVTGANEVNAIYGTTGDDVIYGTSGDDLIYGLGGNDTIYAGAGNDTIFTGVAGFSLVEGGDGNDIMIADPLNIDGVLFVAGAGNNIMIGGAGDDALEAFDDDISSPATFGETGNNIMTGGGGSDNFSINASFKLHPETLQDATITITDFSIAQNDWLDFLISDTNNDSVIDNSDLKAFFQVSIDGNDTVLTNTDHNYKVVLQNVQDVNILDHANINLYNIL